MIFSRDRILTTHVGSLPRNETLSDLLMAQEEGKPYDPKVLSSEMDKAVRHVVQKQMEAGIDASFAAADTNSDGKLTYDEINAWNQAKQGSCDSTSLVSWDGTGTIRRDEYGARYQTAFVSADRNGDGYTNIEEFLEVAAEIITVRSSGDR